MSPSFHEASHFEDLDLNAFLKAGAIDEQEADSELVKELSSTFRPTARSGRLGQLEAPLRAMYAALPKNEDGRLGYATLRYALHRLLAYQHGWYVKGLEPDGTARGDAAAFLRSLREWVPSYLQKSVEKRSGARGFSLHELAALAATIEDLVHREATARLEAVYDLNEIPRGTNLSSQRAESVIDQFFVVYYKGGNWTAKTRSEALQRLGVFKRKFHGWNKLELWLREIRRNETSGLVQADLSFDDAARVVEGIGNQFGAYNSAECRELKSTLLEMEDERPGRVLLSKFYEKALKYRTRWALSEKLDYLRALGAIDESNPASPSVIVPNYVMSRPQCLEASSFYAVCCRDECEELMGQIEREIGEPTASPQHLAELVASLPSDTVAAPRTLTKTVLDRLEETGRAHGGRVPLHGRLFAQWMHHVYPRECPFPHEAGTTAPQTPDEWMRGSGEDSTQASEDEMQCHVSGPCAGGAEAVAAAASLEPAGAARAASATELPWSHAEELLVEL